MEQGFKEFVLYHKSTRNMSNVEILLTSPYRRESSRKKTVFIIKPIKINVPRANRTVHVLSVGFEVEVSLLKWYLHGKLSANQKGDIRTLIDENGMIVTSYNSDIAGFIGNSYSSLFRILHRKNIYRRIQYTECIHTCDQEKSDISEGNITSSSNRKTVTMATFIRTVIYTLLMYLKIFLFLPSPTTPHQSTAEHQDCCKEYDQYQRNFKWQSKLTVEMLCGGCTSRITVSSVLKTNLIQIADHTPRCRCTDSSARKVALGRRVDHIRDICNESSFVDYYRSYQICVLDKQQNMTCSGCLMTNYCITLLIIIVSHYS